MATIRKRKLPSGTIVWQADYADRDSKRRAKQFPTRKAADDYLVTVRSDLKQGRHVAPGASITIADAGELWIERAERDQLVRSTRRQYRQHLTHHISPTLGKVKLSDLTAPRVYSFIDDMLQTTSRATARKVLTSLGSIVEEAVRRGLAAHNPVRSVKMTKATAEQAASAELEMPTKQELRAILGAASGRWRPLVVTAMFTGMRGSELRGLRWSDVDLKAGAIHVRRRVDRWKDFGPPKSKAGKRDIPLAPIVVNELRRWRLTCPKGELDLVFPTPAGGVLAHEYILKYGFGPLQLAAGVAHHVTQADGQTAPRAKYGLHALRHAAAALFIEQGFGPKRIQTILGHASIKMTYDTYGYLFASEEDDRAGMAQIEARLLGS